MRCAGRVGIAVVALTVSVVAASADVAATEAWHEPRGGATTLVSVASSGTAADGGSGPTGVSADGRYVVFASPATNLVPDTNGVDDVFVRDLRRGTTTRVSVSSRGAQANGRSTNPAISGDGRYVAFHSLASNLVPGDTNGVDDVFVRDLRRGTTTRVRGSSRGGLADGLSDWAAVSSDGRYVSFRSAATNLVAGDTNGRNDILVRDLRRGTTTRVSVSTAGGAQADGHSFASALSADGRYVAFDSGATNLVRGDTNGEFDAFVHDRRSGETSRVNVSTGGAQADLGSGWPVVSADGRYVAFTSAATNLVPGDTNLDLNGRPAWDVFVRDRRRGTTTRVSVSSSGAQGDSRSTNPSISADGRYVVFSSHANNLVPGDTTPLNPVTGQPRYDDVFVYDRRTGATTRVNVSSAGEQADAGASPQAWISEISADGRYVVFTSHATNLVPGDANGAPDVFVHDRQGRHG
jgi:Tol biopolymer transport system component